MSFKVVSVVGDTQVKKSHLRTPKVYRRLVFVKPVSLRFTSVPYSLHFLASKAQKQNW